MYLKQIHNIFIKNNYGIQFNPNLLNTISYTATYLKYITLIMKNKYQFIRR